MKRARARAMTHGGASPAKHGVIAISALDGPRCLQDREGALAALPRTWPRVLFPELVTSHERTLPIAIRPFRGPGLGGS